MDNRTSSPFRILLSFVLLAPKARQRLQARLCVWTSPRGSNCGSCCGNGPDAVPRDIDIRRCGAQSLDDLGAHSAFFFRFRIENRYPVVCDLANGMK